MQEQRPSELSNLQADWERTLASVKRWSSTLVEPNAPARERWQQLQSVADLARQKKSTVHGSRSTAHRGNSSQPLRHKLHPVASNQVKRQKWQETRGQPGMRDMSGDCTR